MLKTLAEYERNTSLEKFMAISRQVSSASLPGVSAGYCQRALVDESAKKAKAVPLHAMNALGGVEVYLLLILDLGTRWG
jgi:hypothetical protein